MREDRRDELARSSELRCGYERSLLRDEACGGSVRSKARVICTSLHDHACMAFGTQACSRCTSSLRSNASNVHAHSQSSRFVARFGRFEPTLHILCALCSHGCLARSALLTRERPKGRQKPSLRRSSSERDNGCEHREQLRSTFYEERSSSSGAMSELLTARPMD